jgi:uncharacterized protein YecE (DUF72 family)
MGKLESAAAPISKPIVERPYSEPALYLGTSAFTAAGWAGTFYPPGMAPKQYLSHYATKFRTVEVDSTYYGTPSASTVTAWYEKTSPDFVFAAKVPQIITHEKVLVDCEPEFDEFIGRMDLLHEKLGPLLFQFPHFDKFAFKNAHEFLPRLRAFLKRSREMSPAAKFVVEIRNKSWLDARFADLLREFNVALALTDTSFLPRPWELPGQLVGPLIGKQRDELPSDLKKDQFDLVTADFAYVRWLGDRKAIEAQTTTWDKTVLDRRDDLLQWVKIFRELVKRNLTVYAYANNHYAGNGPGTVKLFWDAWKT